jgi:hypothetical protein
MINSFGIEVPLKTSDGPAIPSDSQVLTVPSVLKAAVPSIAHANADVKAAATKIVLDVQRLTGQVKEHFLVQLPANIREGLKEKIFAVPCESELNQTRKRESNVMTLASKGGDALAQMLAAGTELSIVNIGEGGFVRTE